MLALVSAGDGGTTCPEWACEVEQPVSHPRDIWHVSFAEFTPVYMVVDAHDLYDVITKPAVGSQTDLRMSIHVPSLRFDFATGRFRNK